MGWFGAKLQMPAPEEALPGRSVQMPVAARHQVLGTPMTPPFLDGIEVAYFGMGCFW
ncbi:MAG: peptide-methionine (S)-S-oxide reductase, partial [Acidimicrobiia bacterium]